jgi:hypothetical protein
MLAYRCRDKEGKVKRIEIPTRCPKCHFNLGKYQTRDWCALYGAELTWNQWWRGTNKPRWCKATEVVVKEAGDNE